MMSIDTLKRWSGQYYDDSITVTRGADEVGKLPFCDDRAQQALLTDCWMIHQARARVIHALASQSAQIASLPQSSAWDNWLHDASALSRREPSGYTPFL